MPKSKPSPDVELILHMVGGGDLASTANKACDIANRLYATEKKRLDALPNARRASVKSRSNASKDRIAQARVFATDFLRVHPGSSVDDLVAYVKTRDGYKDCVAKTIKRWIKGVKKEAFSSVRTK